MARLVAPRGSRNHIRFRDPPCPGRQVGLGVDPNQNVGGLEHGGVGGVKVGAARPARRSRRRAASWTSEILGPPLPEAGLVVMLVPHR